MATKNELDVIARKFRIIEGTAEEIEDMLNGPDYTGYNIFSMAYAGDVSIKGEMVPTYAVLLKHMMRV